MMTTKRRPCASLFMAILLGSATLLPTAATQSYAQTPAESVKINFRDADVRSVIESVAELTGRSFVLDPRVKGKITIISPQPIEMSLLYQAVLSALQVQGFQAIEDGAVTRVVPFSQSFNYSGGSGGNQTETRLIKLNYVAASKMVSVLKPVLSRGALIQAFDDSNMLLVTDIVGSIDQAEKLLGEMDDPNAQAVEVINLTHISAGEALHIAGQLKQLQELNLSLVEDSLNNRVIVSGPTIARTAFKSMLASLDVASAKTGGVEVIYLDYSRAADIKPIIDGMLNSEMFLRLAGEAEQNAGSSGYKIEIDESNNALIIAASTAVIGEIRRVVEQLDRSRPQVLIEAVIAELSEDQAKRLSVQLAYADQGHGGYLTKFDNLLSTVLGLGLDGDFSESDVSDLGSLLGSESTSLAVGGSFDQDRGTGIGVLIQALKTDSLTKVLSTPSVVTLDNEEATLSIGQEVPFSTGQYTSSNNGASNPFQTFSREDVGIKLTVKPQISKGDAVRLSLQQESSKLLGTLASATAGNAVTSKSTINTNVLVQDGELLVIGGLIDDQFDRNESKVPLLGDLPVLGALFRSQGKSDGQSVLMMFIRPTIIRDAAVAKEVSRQRYEHLLKRDLEGDQEGAIGVQLRQFHPQGQPGSKVDAE
ncbi:MAG: type II secretion system secretin GspD [Porticoccaceae bacterium]